MSSKTIIGIWAILQLVLPLQVLGTIFELCSRQIKRKIWNFILESSEKVWLYLQYQLQNDSQGLNPELKSIDLKELCLQQ